MTVNSPTSMIFLFPYFIPKECLHGTILLFLDDFSQYSFAITFYIIINVIMY